MTERERNVDHDVNVLSYQYLYCQSLSPLCLLSYFALHIKFISGFYFNVIYNNINLNRIRLISKSTTQGQILPN